MAPDVSIVLGYCLDIFLYGILTVQIYLYYLAFPEDRRITKSIVCFIYMIETLQTALALHDFYILSCTLEDRRDLESPSFDLNTFGFMWFTIPGGGALTALVVQLFFAHRIYVVSRARVITAVVSLLAFLQFTSAIVSAIWVFGPLRTEDSSIAGVSLPIGAASVSVCDLLIAIYMSHYILKQMKGTSKTTQVLVTNLARLLLETGILTAGMVMIATILAFVTEYGVVVPGLSLGKLYANSMLVLLNNRFTIPGGRNVPPTDFPVHSFHLSDLVEVDGTGPILSYGIAFAQSHPGETIRSREEGHPALRSG